MNQRFMLVVLFVLLSSVPCRRELRDLQIHKQVLVVWNIGQGQWTTFIDENYCDHFDFGGEKNKVNAVLRVCQGRTHRLHLSHWDWDHMSEIENLRKKSQKICLWSFPMGKPSLHKQKALAGLPLCLGQKSFHLIFAGDSSKKASSNDGSRVIARAGWLIPGDSTLKEELRWSRDPALKAIHGLVLAHHGSRTSTSMQLLRGLPTLQIAVASARKAKYGHPHKEVLERLKKNKTPVLLTEDWGSLVFEL